MSLPRLTREQREEQYLASLERWNLEGVEKPYVPVDLAQLMRNGIEPAPMLLDDWLYEGELHWIYAEAEAWKTFVCLILAYEVMKQGKRVAWFDEELGQTTIVRRLLALGADPDVIERHFAYLPFPNMQVKDGGATHLDVTRHQATLRHMQPALAVYDTATDFLAAAGLDENSGRDVTEWVKHFAEEARKLGIATVVCDHTAKGGDTAVGSRAKRAKAKVAYYFVCELRGDEATVGRLKVTLTKNTPGNVLPQERIFRIGGNGDGGFVFELAETRTASTPAARTAGKHDAIRKRIADTLQEHGELNQSQIVHSVDGGEAMIRKVLASMAAEPHISGVESEPRGRSLVYRWIGKAEVPT